LRGGGWREKNKEVKGEESFGQAILGNQVDSHIEIGRFRGKITRKTGSPNIGTEGRNSGFGND